MAERHNKTPDQIAFEVEVERRMREGELTYGDFELRRDQEGNSLWHVESYKGKPGTPDPSLQGSFVGHVEMLRRCTAWMIKNDIPLPESNPSVCNPGSLPPGEVLRIRKIA